MSMPQPAPNVTEPVWYPLFAVTRRGGLLTFFCPFCRRRHYHGGTGHRIAHCTDRKSPYFKHGYWLVEVGATA
jgi:hypothetical protein